MDRTLTTFERDGHKAVVTLRRPESLNAINSQMDRELLESFTEIRDNPDIWVGIVTGEGAKSFSAGHDMKEPGAPPYGARPRVPPIGGLHRDTKVWKPMIAAINGYCLGAGMEMALSCDIRICASHAEFGLPEVRWSLLAAAGGLTRMPRNIPRAVAMEMILTGERISAQQAFQWGLVTHVVPLAELMPLAHALADKILNNAPLAVWAAKEIAVRTQDMTIEDSLALETSFNRGLLMTEDHTEGPAAFAQKRKPSFKAR